MHTHVGLKLQNEIKFMQTQQLMEGVSAISNGGTFQKKVKVANLWEKPNIVGQSNIDLIRQNTKTVENDSPLKKRRPNMTKQIREEGYLKTAEEIDQKKNTHMSMSNKLPAYLKHQHRTGFKKQAKRPSTFPKKQMPFEDQEKLKLAQDKFYWEKPTVLEEYQ